MLSQLHLKQFLLIPLIALLTSCATGFWGAEMTPVDMNTLEYSQEMNVAIKKLKKDGFYQSKINSVRLFRVNTWDGSSVLKIIEEKNGSSDNRYIDINSISTQGDTYTYYSILTTAKPNEFKNKKYFTLIARHEINCKNQSFQSLGRVFLTYDYKIIDQDLTYSKLIYGHFSNYCEFFSKLKTDNVK